MDTNVQECLAKRLNYTISRIQCTGKGEEWENKERHYNLIASGVRTPSHKLQFTIWCCIRLSLCQFGSFYDHMKDLTVIFCLNIRAISLVKLSMYMFTLISPLQISEGSCII